MDDLPKRQILRNAMKDNKQLVVKLRGIMRDAGIEPEPAGEHKPVFHHEAIINPNAASSVTAEDNGKQTLLSLSADHEQNDNVDSLVTACVEARTKFNKTPLRLSAEIGDKELVGIFLEAGATADAEDIDKQTPLHISALNGYKEIVELLLKAGATVDAKDYDKQTPLHLSAWKGLTEIVELLLKAGADVDAKDYDKQTPLHLSAWNGQQEITEILLKARATVDAKDANKKTSLHWSAINGHIEIVKILLRAGAAVDIEDTKKQTPLHESVKHGQKDIVEYLLKAGANANAEDHDKQTPLHMSAIHGQKDILIILLKAGATVDAEDIYKQTPLHLCVKYDQADMAEFLLRCGASVKKRDIHGLSILDYMKKSERIKYESKSRSKFSTLRRMIKKKTKSVRDSVFTTTEIRHTETVSTTLTTFKSYIKTSEKSTSNDGFKVEEREIRQTSGAAVGETTATSSGSASLSAPIPTVESRGLCDDEAHELNIAKQIEDHWLQFSLKLNDKWKTKCSSDVKAAFRDGKVIIPTVIHVKCEKNTTNNISHAELVTMNSRVSLHQSQFYSDNELEGKSASMVDIDNYI